MYFNSHPHEEDDGIGGKSMEEMEHFNSHPHEEDDEERSEHLRQHGISTHILTRRMTEIILQSQQVLEFQLTSSRGG